MALSQVATSPIKSIQSVVGNFGGASSCNINIAAVVVGKTVLVFKGYSGAGSSAAGGQLNSATQIGCAASAANSGNIYFDVVEYY